MLTLAKPARLTLFNIFKRLFRQSNSYPMISNYLWVTPYFCSTIVHKPVRSKKVPHTYTTKTWNGKNF